MLSLTRFCRSQYNTATVSVLSNQRRRCHLIYYNALGCGAGPEAANGEPRSGTGQAAQRKRAARGTAHSPRGRGGRGTTGARARGPRAAGFEDADAALQAAAALSDAAELWDEGDEAAGDSSESGELADGHDMPALPGLPSRVQSVATELPSREQSDGAKPSPSRADPPADAARQKKPRRRVSFAAPADSDDAQDNEGLSPMAEPDSATADAPQAALVHPKRRGRKVVSDDADAAADATGGDAGPRSRASAEGPPKRKRKQTTELSNGGVSRPHGTASADGPPKRKRKQSQTANIRGDATSNGTLANGTSQQPVESPKQKAGRPSNSKPAAAATSDVTDGQAPLAVAPKRKAGRPAKAKPVKLMPDIPTRGKPAESPKRKRGRPPKAKPSAEPDGQQEGVKRKRGRPPKAKPSAVSSEQASNGSVAASGDPQPDAAQGLSAETADLDTAALLRASQLQMAAIEAALAEDD